MISLPISIITHSLSCRLSVQFINNYHRIQLLYQYKQMRAINNQKLLSSLFAIHQAYLFSKTPKKAKPGFQFCLQKQQHKQDADFIQQSKNRNAKIWDFNDFNQKQLFDPTNLQIPYLGLKHLQQAYRQQAIEAKLTKAHLESINLSNQTKKKNSQQFVKLISHSLSKQTCLQIFNLIQVYCEELRTPQYRKIEPLLPSFRHLDTSKNSLESLFTKIRSILMHEMIQDSKNKEQNIEYANNLMKTLAEADLNSITLRDFERNSGHSDYLEQGPNEIKGFLNLDYINQVSISQDFPSIDWQKNSFINDSETQNSLPQASKLNQSQNKLKVQAKNKRTQGTSRQIKIKVAPDQLIIFTKIPQLGKYYEENMRQSKKYAYLYDLPYNVSESQCMELIAHFQSAKGIKVSFHELLTYDRYLKLQPLEKVHIVPDYFQVDGLLTKIYKQVDVDMYLKPNKNNKSSKGKSTGQQSVLSQTTDVLLKKIKREKYSILNRSVLILKFDSEQQKKKLIQPELRLYGVNFKHLRNVKIQQGFSKNILKVHCIPPGCTTTQLNDFFNLTLKPLGYSLQVEKNLYLTKNFVFIQFQHFTEVLHAMKILQRQRFQEKQLKAEIAYGAAKVFKGIFSPSLQNPSKKLKQKMVEVSKHYLPTDEKEGRP